jgi:ABC-type uncharacterized transport system ATPase subunit
LFAKLPAWFTVLHFGRPFAQGTIDEIIAHEGVQETYLGKA